MSNLKVFTGGGSAAHEVSGEMADRIKVLSMNIQERYL